MTAIDGREIDPASACPDWRAHFRAIQAVCDALGWAAQQEMAKAIELGDTRSRVINYGIWIGVGYVQRIAEGWDTELGPAFQEAVRRIKWTPGAEFFDFPGRDALVVAKHMPGETPEESA